MRVLRASRPTAVNLAWALDEMRGDPVARARARDPPRRGRALPARWPRMRPACSQPGTRALTHCNAGGLATGGYGSAVGALLARLGAGPARARLGRRDPAAAAGRPPDGVGARDSRHPARRDRRLRRGVADGGGRGRLRAHRRRPHRRQRRHREQDRHLRARGARRATTGSRSTSSRRARPSTTRRATAPTIPIEERDPAEVTARFAARNPAFDVTPAELITAIVTEHGVHRAPYARVAARGGGRGVKALLLAAGYATRLRPLTDTMPKPLLPVGGRPMIDWILDRVAAVGEIDEVHVVTNSRTRAAFERWAAGARGDASTTTGRRRTRTASARSATSGFAIEHGGLAGDDLLVIAADNLFEFSLADYAGLLARQGRRQRASPSTGSPTRRLRASTASSSSTPTTGSSGFEEKPEQPRSDLVSTAHVPLLGEHTARCSALPRRGEPARPARDGFIDLALPSASPSTASASHEEWLDIGDPAQLLEADNRYRARAGLPARAEYALELCRRRNWHTPDTGEVHGLRPYRVGVAPRSRSPRAAPPAASRARSATVLPAPLVRFRAAALRPLRRADRVAGRRAAASARAAVSRSRRPARQSSTAARPVRSCGRGRSAASARSPPLPPRLVADVVPRPAPTSSRYIPPDGDRSLRRGHHPAHGLSPRARRRCGRTRAPLPLLGGAARQPADGALARRAAAERPRGVRCDARRVAGAIVLVDDVYTTGRHGRRRCAAALRAGAGRATRVESSTFARAVR